MTRTRVRSGHAGVSRGVRRPGPIGTFGVLAIATAAALIGLQATGAAAPHIGVGGMAGEGVRPDGRRFYAAEITNDGTLPVHISAADWPVTGMDDAVVLVGPPGSSSLAREPAPPSSWAGQAAPFRPFTLQGGEHRLVYLAGPPGCFSSGGGSTVQFERLRLRARPAAGPTRSISVPRTDGSRALGCSAR